MWMAEVGILEDYKNAGPGVTTLERVTQTSDGCDAILWESRIRVPMNLSEFS